MCNRYGTPRPEDITSTFNVPLLTAPYAPVLGPRQPGPFVRPGRVDIGQWGIIPWFSNTRVPLAKDGRPLMTNNCRSETMSTAPTFKGAWAKGQRCLVPALTFDEPYWGTGKNIWWRFARKDGAPWAIAGLWSDWTDPETGEIVPSYTMVTMNADAHPLLSQMHRTDPKRAIGKQDKRAVVPLEPALWDQWLNGSNAEAMSAIQLPAVELFAHGPADPKVTQSLIV